MGNLSVHSLLYCHTPPRESRYPLTIWLYPQPIENVAHGIIIQKSCNNNTNNNNTPKKIIIMIIFYQKVIHKEIHYNRTEQLMNNLYNIIYQHYIYTTYIHRTYIHNIIYTHEMTNCILGNILAIKTLASSKY